MQPDKLPIYRRLSFKFLASAALFILLIEGILLYFSVGGMRDRLLYVRRMVLNNVPPSLSLAPRQVLPDDQVQAMVHRYGRNIVLMVGLILTVVLGGLYGVIRYWFLRPLQTLLEANRRAISGNIEMVKERDIPADEIGSIMRSRNKMLETINTLYNEEALETLCEAVDAKDEYTEGHSRRVGTMGARIGNLLGLEEQQCERIQHSGSLHDVGKIALDDSILTKEGTLTEGEFEKVKEHPERGEKIIQFSNMHPDILQGIRHHHERYDGTGYPDGLAGEEIPRIARILAVTDALDAMLSDRHYRDALSLEEAREELLDNRGSQFDPRITDVAVDWLEPGRRLELPSFPSRSVAG